MSKALPRMTMLIGLLGALLIAALLPGMVLAQSNSPLSVTFEASPLFLDADVKPGDSTTRTVTVENTGQTSESLYVTVQNTFDTGGLSQVMQLTVREGATEYFSGTFADFFTQSPLLLGTSAPDSGRTLAFTASLPTTAGNEYQSTQFGFDLVVGFVGGAAVTDTPGGGGGGRGVGTLQISNEAVNVEGDAATISWTTNRPATSFVVCGLASRAPFILTPNAPFGYDFVLPESTELVSSHSLSQAGLAPGEYRCRPASREATNRPFTVGREVVFTIVAPPGLVAGEELAVSPPATPFISGTWQQPTGSVLGIGKKGLHGGPTYDEWLAELERERAERETLDELHIATSALETARPREISEMIPGLRGWRAWLTENRTLGGLFLLLLVLLLAGWWYRRQYT